MKTIVSLKYDSFPEPPDYFSFVDEDIREMFKNKGGYKHSDILTAQLIKELRKNNEKEI